MMNSRCSATTQAGRCWHVGYTRRPSIWDDTTKSVDFADFVKCQDDSGEKLDLKSAFVTTFGPCPLSFLASHIGSTACKDTTLFVEDGAIGGYECDICERDLREIGGRVWTCPGCEKDVCRECVRKRTSPPRCDKGHLLRELLPGLFVQEDGAHVSEIVFDEDTECYSANVEFDEAAPHHLEGFKVIVPRKPGTFCVHTKMMVLNFSDKVLRLVISSFNMCEIQWEMAGDVFWWADLPLMERANPHMARVGREQTMHAPLHDFLSSIGGKAVTDLLDRAHWRALFRGYSGSEKVGLHVIASVPGHFDGSRLGLKRLGDVLRRMEPHFPKTGCPVRIQCWSIGGSQYQWYRTFVSHLSQDFRSLYSDTAQVLPPDCQAQFIVQTPGKGDTRSFDQRMVTRQCLWHDPSHPLMKESAEKDEELPVDKRRGWHSKVMYRMYPPGLCRAVNCSRVHGWAYVGSHNCSAASWGVVRKQNISIKNFELGLVIISLPSMRSSTECCGVDLQQAVPIPWSSVSSLQRYTPTPEFTRNVAGVKTFSGNVATISSDQSFFTIKASPYFGDHDGSDSDESELGDDDDDDHTKQDVAETTPIDAIQTQVKHLHVDENSNSDEDKHGGSSDDDECCDAEQDVAPSPQKKLVGNPIAMFKVTKRDFMGNHGVDERDWPPPVGTSLVFDVSRDYDIFHFY